METMLMMLPLPAAIMRRPACWVQWSAAIMAVRD